VKSKTKKGMSFLSITREKQNQTQKQGTPFIKPKTKTKSMDEPIHILKPKPKARKPLKTTLSVANAPPPGGGFVVSHAPFALAGARAHSALAWSLASCPPGSAGTLGSIGIADPMP